MRASALLIAALLSAYPSAALPQEIRLIDTETVRDKFETSMSIAREYLATVDPPKYHLYKAAVTFSVTSGADGSVSGKIPAAIVSAAFTGKYGEISTVTKTYTYMPRDSIPVNFDDFGVLAFVSDLQSDIKEQLRESDHVVTNAELEGEFVVMAAGEAEITFLAVASLGVDVEVKNKHKMTFYFCLLGNDGQCIQ